MTRHAATARLVKMILRDSKSPVVLDADALNVFEGEAAMLAKKKNVSWLLPPHPGEMARLLGISTARVQSNRFKICRASKFLDAFHDSPERCRDAGG